MKKFLRVLFGVIALAAAAFFLIGGLTQIGKEDSYIYFLIISAMFAVLGYILIRRSKTTKAISQATSAPAIAQDPAPAPTIKVTTHHTDSFKLAGVTFNNPDGSSRQYLLEKLATFEPPFDSCCPDYQLREDEYKGEPALAVICDNHKLGNVPRDIVPRLLQYVRNDQVVITNIDIDSFIPEDKDSEVYYATVEVEYDD